jgi:hypothetical protein
MIATQANLTHSRTPVDLLINTDALALKRLNDSQILYSHRMEGISFASAGEHVRIPSNWSTHSIDAHVVVVRVLGHQRLRRLRRKG